MPTSANMTMTAIAQVLAGVVLCWLCGRLQSQDNWQLFVVGWIAMAVQAWYVCCLNARVAAQTLHIVALQREAIRQRVTTNDLQDTTNDLRATTNDLQDTSHAHANRFGDVQGALATQQAASARTQAAAIQTTTAIQGSVNGLVTLMKCMEGRLDPLEIGSMCPGTRSAPATTTACDEAACRGRLDILQRLRDPVRADGVVHAWGPTTVKNAVMGGHLEILLWLRNPNTGGGACPWDESAILAAVQSTKANSMRILMALRNPRVGDPAPWHPDTTAVMASRGAFQMLTWSRDPANGTPVPWNARAVHVALASGNELIVRWLTDPEGGACPHQPITSPLYTMVAAAQGHIGILEWLRDPATGNGVCEMDRSALEAAETYGHHDAIAWLRDPTKGGMCPQ